MVEADAKNSQRLFFSLWPSDGFRRELESATHAIARDSGGRVIPAENLHVTLLFLGQILRSQLQVVQQAALAASAVPPFELVFDRFESWGRANLLCLATSSVPRAASELSEKLRQSLQSAALGSSEHEFRPHITIARDLPRKRHSESIKPLLMQANDFVLVKSRPGPNGSRYAVLERWPLAGSPHTPKPVVAHDG